MSFFLLSYIFIIFILSLEGIYTNSSIYNPLIYFDIKNYFLFKNKTFIREVNSK